jgi:hypothetical protein
MESALEWVVLRPGLVLSPQAYGGSALLRALAEFPIIVPIAYADNRLQTVSVDDVARAVCQALDGKLPVRRVYDLVEDTSHALRDVISLMRARYGLPSAPVIQVPALLASCVSRVADLLGWLGWRSPLRTTAMAEMSAGVMGNPAPWKQAGGFALKSLPETLRTLPSTVQDHWFARLYFLKPIVIGTLALFWFITGCVALADLPRAMATLLDHGVGVTTATAIVLIGSLVDIVLGLAILVRPLAGLAALGMIATTLAYLAGATHFAADLWSDPLGPLVKAVPAMVLAVVALSLLEDR